MDSQHDPTLHLSRVLAEFIQNLIIIFLTHNKYFHYSLKVTLKIFQIIGLSRIIIYVDLDFGGL